jgi:tripartite-type tricarboxylate transporter receptor subunit TctC
MERAPDLPDVPAVAEIVPGFEFTTWYGLSVPKGTPADVRDKLYEATQQALDDPATMQKIAELGYTAIKETQEEFTEFLKSDIQRISELIAQSQVKQQ